MTQTQTTVEQEMLLSLTLHNFPAEMLREFAKNVVKPYFNGNLNEAIRCLMQKAVEEETLVNHAIRKNP
ncbi:MAG: hypothetical protein NWE93_03225 [Candidatus Bathyarchaeota archaeon]|nr:hypothetical protein [Candidatus Bathyarchaeota archaeon]